MAATRALVALAVLGGVAAGAGVLLWGRAHERDGEPLEWSAADPAHIAGTALTEDVAKSFFPQLERPTNRMMYDPVATIVLRPDRNQSFDWPEHPAGRVTFRTNNLGFREDRPTQVEKQGPRLLVLGDSHTEGQVNNDENVAHVLERLLQERPPERTGAEPDGGSDASQAALRAAGVAPRFEVLNAAVGGTGPHEYLGRLRKHLDLRPDLVIVVLYCGNDFSNALMMSDFATKRERAPRSAEYKQRLDEAGARWPKLVPQGFNQACQFREWPGEDELALAAARDDLLAMARLCDGIGARLLVACLPSLPDVQPDSDRATVDALLAALHLDAEAFGASLRLGRRLCGELEGRGVACLDPAAAMAAAETPLYWRADHHLNVAGHALLARLLHERIGQGFALAGGALVPRDGDGAGETPGVRR